MAAMLLDENGFYEPGAGGPHHDIRADEVAICRAFLAKCKPTVQTRWNSFDLKCLIDRAAGKWVSNGACIQAALDLGLPIKPGHGTRTRIGVTRRSVLNASLQGRAGVH